MTNSTTLRAFGLLALMCCSPLPAQAPASADPVFLVTPVAERVVSRLSNQPLYWRIERFGNATDAARAASPESLMVDIGGETWRFTLTPRDAAPATGRMMATIGPVPVIRATRYLLRINRAGGPPGAATPVHTHPGSEAFHVLAGRLCQRTEHGTAMLDAGKSMNGHAPGMIMQLHSCGSVPLDQFVMFVVDADQPFSSPAAFPAR